MRLRSAVPISAREHLLQRSVLPITVAALLATGCRRDPIDHDADLPLGSPPPAPAELSRFSAPLNYDFGPVMTVVERVVPTKFGSLDSVHQIGNDERRHYAFEAERGEFSARAQDSMVFLRAVLTYAARGFFKPPIGPTLSGGCGGGSDTASRPRVVVEIAAPLTLDSTWHLKSKSTLVTVEPASKAQRDRCDVTFLHHDVTDRVVEAARTAITKHLDGIDKKVASVDLTERVQPLWRTLGTPIRLRDGVWLVLDPRKLAIGKASGRAHTLTIPVTLEAQPKIVTSTEEPAVSDPQLPALSHAIAGDGFHISLDGEIDYGAASEMLTTALRGRRIKQKAGTITIINAQIAPAANGKLALTVWFDGDAAGRLRFVGTPSLDTLPGKVPKHEIVMRDLDYDLATTNPLLQTYAWLRSDDMRSTFRDHAHIGVDTALGKGRELLASGLNRKMGDATLSAQVNTVAMRGLFVTRAGLIVRGEATGNASITMRPR
jgi:hypothetical protein